MDQEWLTQFDYNASTCLPEHQICCWSKEGFIERTKAFPKILKRIRNVKSVLDVGCGTGHYCRELKDLGYEVIGVDYSQNMINKAKSLSQGIEFKQGDGYNLPFEDNSFDLVISIGVLQCLEQEDLFLSELKRVSKNHIIISTLRRAAKVSDPKKVLKEMISRDPMPARTYHPDEILQYFKEYKTKLITKVNESSLSDCFFLIASVLESQDK